MVLGMVTFGCLVYCVANNSWCRLYFVYINIIEHAIEISIMRSKEIRLGFICDG